MDILREEAEEYAAALSKAEVPVSCVRYNGMPHGFLSMLGITTKGADAFLRIGAFIHRRRIEV